MKRACNSSEREPDGDLHRARIARQTRDRPERRRAADVAVRQPEIDRVEDVEDVPPESRAEAWAEAHQPLHREIHVLESRPGQAVALLVAEGARRHRLE